METTPQADQDSPRMPEPALPGFEHINRYWDPLHKGFAAKILPGEYYVTCREEMIVTVLGSCVAACIRDAKLGIGGMNHFMLPVQQAPSGGSWDPDIVGHCTRYGSYAMERLINDILRNGGRRQHLEIKIFGGGRILTHMTDIGRKNIDFVRRYLEAEGLRLVASDVGGAYARKVYYRPATGRAYVKKLTMLRNDTILQREKAYMQELEGRPARGDVTLF
jgi:chemotaxis protein CheD